jgi:hypothetical protein
MAELRLNPSLQVEVKFEARIKGGLAQHHTLTPASAEQLWPALLYVLQQLHLGQTPSLDRLPPEAVAQLQQLGVLLAPEQCPEPVSFTCPLPEAVTFPLSPRGRLFVNPQVQLQLPGHSPPVVSPAPSEAVPCLWVTDLRTGVTYPWQIPPRWWPFLSQWPQLPDPLPEALIEGLCRAGALLSEHPVALLQAAQAQQATLHQAYQEQGYVVFPQLIPALPLAAWQDYCARLEAQGYLELGDPLVPDRLRFYNEPWAQCVHQQLPKLMGKALGQAVQASFCYLSVYPEGSYLKQHLDRPQCVWNLSLLLHPQPADAPSWPLYIQTPQQGGAAIHLQPGDAVLYSGRKHPHWRDVLGAGQRVTVCSMHFVPQDFIFELD